MLRNVPIILAALVIGVAPSGRAQSARPQFETASIRYSPNQSLGRTGLFYTLADGHVSARGVTFRVLIFEVYDLKAAGELIGAPDWIDTVRWDLDAVSAANSTREQMMSMLRSLLEDKFRLLVHKDEMNAAGTNRPPIERLVIDSASRPPEN